MAKLLRFVFGALLALAIVAVVGRFFFFQVVRIDSYSMVPNLVAGDYFLVFTSATLGPGDVAVCKNPTQPQTMVALRIMGVPGSTFSMHRNHLVLNGKKVQHERSEPIVYEDRNSAEIMEFVIDLAQEYVGGQRYIVALMDRAGSKSFDHYKVKNGFFLVGDNRNKSYDSRKFGEIPISDCIGRAFLVVWPGPDSGDLKQSTRFLEWIH